MSENKQRSKNTPEECAVIVKAWAEGKDIEYWSDCNQKWMPKPAPTTAPGFARDLYRIRSEPRTFEFWTSPTGNILGQIAEASEKTYIEAGWTKIKAKEIV